MMTFDFYQLINFEYPTKFNNYGLYFLIGVLIGVFLNFFQPFGLGEFAPDYKMTTLFVFGFLVAILLCLNLFIFNQLFGPRWTILLQLLLTISAIFLVSIGVYIYAYSLHIFDEISLTNYFFFLKQSLAIAVFPIGITLYQVFREYRSVQPINPEHDLDSDLLLENSISLFSLDKKNKLTLPSESIVYFESIRNYVEIVLVVDDHLEFYKLRSTLKNIEIQLSKHNHFRKVHRAFIVNIDLLEKVNGRSKKMTLSLSGIEREIPISRDNVKAIRHLIES